MIWKYIHARAYIYIYRDREREKERDGEIGLKDMYIDKGSIFHDFPSY